MALWQDYQKPKRLKMIEDWLEYRDPKEYRRMKKDGTLQEFLLMKEEAMMQEFEELDDRVTERLAKTDLPHLEAIQEANAGTAEAWRTVIANHLE